MNMKYEQGRAAVSLEMLDEIAKVLLINITGLLPETRENENSEVELSRLIEEYKKIKSQELRHVLIKSLFESIQVCKEFYQYYFKNSGYLLRRNSTSLK